MRLLSPARLAVAFIAVGTVLSSCSGTAAIPARSSPIPNLRGLQARVRTIQPRVRSLAPRVVDVAPRPSSPNSFAINTDVLFAFDRADLSLNAQSVLATVVQKLDQDPAGTVSITGYTDDIGAPDYNVGLSERRAASVQAYLQAHVDNPGLHYRAQGFGEADPVAPNQLPNGQDNPAGRQQNRRVVIAYTAS
jgi:outer membrane protein OmpA-like peptidoglycan-associated protein